MNSIQQKSHAKISLFVFTLLCNMPCAYAMEKPVNNTEITTSVFGPAHSLKNQCINYIGAHADEVGVLSNLPYLPADVASDIVANAELSYIAKHKDMLISLVHENALDHAVASAIACALCNYKTQEGDATICVPDLIRAIAKNGTLSCNLANAMLTDFTNTEIPDNFDELFDIYFSKDILENNEQLLCCLLSVAEVSFREREQLSAVPFPVEEFEKQLSPTFKAIENSSLIETTCDAHKKYKKILAKLWHDRDKILTTCIDPEHNVLLIHSESCFVGSTMSFIKLINIKTLVSMGIPCFPASMQKRIGLNSDCSGFGIMMNDDTINFFVLPAAFATFSPSLKQWAFLFYIHGNGKALIKQMAECLNGDLSLANLFKAYSMLPIDKMYKLMDFIKAHDKELGSELLDLTLKILPVINEYAVMQFVADELNMDMAMLSDKLISGEVTVEQVGAIMARRNNDNNQNNNL